MLLTTCPLCRGAGTITRLLPPRFTCPVDRACWLCNGTRHVSHKRLRQYEQIRATVAEQERTGTSPF